MDGGTASRDECAADVFVDWIVKIFSTLDIPAFNALTVIIKSAQLSEQDVEELEQRLSRVAESRGDVVDSLSPKDIIKVLFGLMLDKQSRTSSCGRTYCATVEVE